MTRDRLKALQSVSGQIEERRPEPGLNPAFSVDEEYDCMEHFFRQVEQARALIQEVKEHVKQMKRLHSSILSSPRPDQETKKELDQRASQVKTAVNKISTILKALERDEDLNSNSASASSAACARIRRTQHSTCLHLLVDAITEFNNEQEDYKTKCEERIRRVISIARVEVSEEKMENLLETGNFGSIFNGDIITETLEARQALEDVTARHEEILKLERSIRDLRDLFVEMSVLVETQGDMIDNIQRQVQQTKDHVEKAANVAKKAVKYQSKFRHKRILLYSIAALVLVGLIVGLVISFAVPSPPPTYSPVPTQQPTLVPSNRSVLNVTTSSASREGVVALEYNATLSSTTVAPVRAVHSTTAASTSTVPASSVDIELLPGSGVTVVNKTSLASSSASLGSG